VRQALNFAIDRDHVVDLLGGPVIERPTCQILPPNIQGYVTYCPYTLEPDSGVWSAPDLGRAQALIEDANATGAKVTVWVTDGGGLPTGAVDTMRYVTGVLNDIGLSAHLKIVHSANGYFDPIYPPAVAGTPEHPQVFMSGWIYDYPGAANFIDTQFRCGAPGNPSGYCSESVDAQIDEAYRLQATDLAASNSAWAEVEHRLVDEAVWAPLTNPLAITVVSSRTKNVQVNPQWGVLLDSLWVR
jgi:peptide/nickel transport system substrate-binding protein